DQPVGGGTVAEDDGSRILPPALARAEPGNDLREGYLLARALESLDVRHDVIDGGFARQEQGPHGRRDGRRGDGYGGRRRGGADDHGPGAGLRRGRGGGRGVPGQGQRQEGHDRATSQLSNVSPQRTPQRMRPREFKVP